MQLVELQPQLRLQAFVLEREPHGGAGRPQEPGALEQHRVVDDGRHGHVGVAEHGDGAAGIAGGQLHRAADAIDIIGPAVREPERELEGRVAERPRKRVRTPPGGVWSSSTSRSAAAERPLRAASRPAASAIGTASSAIVSVQNIVGLVQKFVDEPEKDKAACTVARIPRKKIVRRAAG